MRVNTPAWNQSYKNIITDSFLEEINNSIEKNIESKNQGYGKILFLNDIDKLIELGYRVFKRQY